MERQRFADGAIVFWRARGIEPRLPEELEAIAARHSFIRGFLPQYAGDRVAIVRAIDSTRSGLARQGLLLRPIRRTGTEISFGIVRERRSETAERLDHDFEDVVGWTSEPNPALVRGDHPVAVQVAQVYRELRGKVTAEDWSRSISAHLELLAAARLRAGVFWVPPTSVEMLSQLGALLGEVGIDLVVCEVEAQAREVVRRAAVASLDEQLADLQQEVDGFDGTQRPSTYARRLEEFRRLRERALVYKAALGLGVEQAEAALQRLEDKVAEMLEIRASRAVHRDGSLSASAAAPKPGPEAAAEDAISDGAGGNHRGSVLRFGHAVFQPAASDDPAVLTFTSDDAEAGRRIEVLERLGLASRWQRAGSATVCVQNSGPSGSRFSIRVRLRPGGELRSVARELGAFGIELVDEDVG